MHATDEQGTEEIRRARERNEMRRAAEEPREPERLDAPALLEQLRQITERSAARDLERQRLPCASLRSAGDFEGAARACEAAGASTNCAFARDPNWCAIERLSAAERLAADNLRRADVPRLFVEILTAATREGLRETEPLRLVRAFLANRAAGVTLDDGNTIALHGGEWLLVLAGAAGTGKSLAAAYAIAREGGIWLAARDLANPKRSLEEAERAPLLVLDDLGTEYAGEGGYGPARAADLLALRHAEQRRTLVTTNLRRRRRSGPDEPPQFVERYGARIDDRIRERGRYVSLTGPSLRGEAP